jgi:hypothetical protein
MPNRPGFWAYRQIPEGRLLDTEVAADFVRRVYLGAKLPEDQGSTLLGLLAQDCF